jgi:hypothetical protein
MNNLREFISSLSFQQIKNKNWTMAFKKTVCFHTQLKISRGPMCILGIKNLEIYNVLLIMNIPYLELFKHTYGCSCGPTV